VSDGICFVGLDVHARKTAAVAVQQGSGDHHGSADLAIYLHLMKALCRTRTGDPFLTMEVLYQLS
jgi:hypothetical protein